MKLNVGLGSVDNYLPFCDAGAEEFFAGYIPFEWTLNYKNLMSPNRREVLNYNVQIGSRSELALLSEYVRRRGVPVKITLNSLYYLPEQYQLLKELVEDCMSLGFCSFIVADPYLIYYLRKELPGKKLRLILSGEFGEVNEGVLSLCRQWEIERLIFHRKVTIQDMETLMSACPELEYESFFLNEACQFHGGYCNSLHCDELTHMCRVPWKPEKRIEDLKEFCQEEELFGSGGCGLCALWDLNRIGIDSLKLVTRGNYTDCTMRDLILTKKALHILEESSSKEAYVQTVKKELFQEGCSGNCYYREFFK